MSHCARVTAGIVAVAALMAGCSSAGGSSAAHGTTSPAAVTSSAAAPSTAAATTSAAPTTTEPVTASPSPTSDPRFHKYDSDPAVIAYLAYIKNHEQAARLRNPNFPALIHSTSHSQWQIDSDDMARRLAAGQTYKGAGIDRVLAVSSSGPTDKVLGVCETNNLGVWTTKSGKPADPVTKPWSSYNIHMTLDKGVWKAANVNAGTVSCKGVT